jgi:hypothetical protein
MVGDPPKWSLSGIRRSARNRNGEKSARPTVQTKGYWSRRLQILLIIGVAGGLTAAVSSFVSPSTPAPTASSLSPSLITGTGKVVLDQAQSPGGFIISTKVGQGIGCEGRGSVFPLSVTPGMSAHIRPGKGPKHGGSTWDQDPRGFGAVPAGPLTIGVSVTGPKGHAVTITGLTLHVLARKPQVVGPWLNRSQGCGTASTSYHSAVADLDTPTPYYLDADKLPGSVRADRLTFPHVARTDDPEGLKVTVRTEHCDCVWDATLTWTDGDKHESKTIDDHGYPFETTSVTGQPGVNWYNPSATGSTKAWLTKPLSPV